MFMVASVVTVLQLVLDPASVTRGLPVPVIAEEVRSIWKPYLDVVMGGPDDAWVPCRQSLHLRITDRPSPGGQQDASALGWIEFVDGEPAPLVTVSVQRARNVLMDALWMGRSLQLLPAAVGTRFVARALGRAIAHEIGHYLLRSAAHVPEGLMRARFTARDFLDERTARFRLTAPEQERLALALAAGPRAVACPLVG